MSNDLQMIPIGMDVPSIAHAFAASGMFKDARDQAQAITKILAGRSIGLDPYSAMAGMHVMDGKIEVGGHLIAARVKASGRYDYRITEHTERVCRIEWRELVGGRWEVVGESSFSMEEAERAGLTGRGQNYKRYPKAMLFNRAISSGYRLYAPDIFMTPVYADGELGGEEQPAPSAPAPRPATATAPRQPAPAPAPAQAEAIDTTGEVRVPEPAPAAPPEPAPSLTTARQRATQLAARVGEHRDAYREDVRGAWNDAAALEAVVARWEERIAAPEPEEPGEDLFDYPTPDPVEAGH